MSDYSDSKAYIVGVPMLVSETVQHVLQRKGYDVTVSNEPSAGAALYVVESVEYLLRKKFYDSVDVCILIYVHSGRCPEGTSGCFDAYTSPATLQSLIPTPMGIDSADTGKEELSAREIDVIRQMASGKTYKEIADCLGISINTVLTHRKNITAKLGIRSVAGLSLYAMMNGLLKG